MELPDYVLAVLGMPSSIYGAVQFWEWIAKPSEKSETIELQATLQTAASTDRVLLEFDRNSMSKPGTWEYGIASFYRRLPRHYRGQGVARPVSLLNRAHAQMRIAVFISAICALLFLGTLYTGLVRSGLIATWQMTDRWLLDCFQLFAFGLGAVGRFLRYRMHLQASKIIIEYDRYFRENGYDIGIEFTHRRPLPTN